MPNRDIKEFKDLPFASSLCGSCSDVCPVKIDIHSQLYQWRQEITKEHGAGTSKKLTMNHAAKVMSDPKSFIRWTKLMRLALKRLPRWMIYSGLNTWGKNRELPEVPKQSFMEWYKNQNK